MCALLSRTSARAARRWPAATMRSASRSPEVSVAASRESEIVSTAMPSGMKGRAASIRPPGTAKLSGDSRSLAYPIGSPAAPGGSGAPFATLAVGSTLSCGRAGEWLPRGSRIATPGPLVLQTAVLGGEHQVAQERLLVDPQQVRLVALHVGADDVPVRGDAHQMSQRLRIPSPRQFQLAERAIVGLEFRGERLARRIDRHGFAAKL